MVDKGVWIYDTNEIQELKSIIDWMEEDFREGLTVDIEELIYLKDNLKYLEGEFK